MPNHSQFSSRLIQGAEAAATSQPDMLNMLITTLNVVIASAADPYLVSAALIEGLATTVAQKGPDEKQGEVSVAVMRLLRSEGAPLPPARLCDQTTFTVPAG